MLLIRLYKCVRLLINTVIMNRFILFILLLPKALWRRMGADVEQLKAILRVRLLLDGRRPMGMSFRKNQSNKKVNTAIATSILSFLFGLMYLLPLFAMEQQAVMALAFNYSLFLVMMVLMLTSDFVNVLFDARDKYILLPRPISSQTLFLSKMLHIFVYLTRSMLPMALPSWIVVGILFNYKMVLLFPLVLMLLMALALFFVNGIYLLILKLMPVNKFKDALNSIQILFSIIIFFSMYIGPHLINFDAIEQIKWSHFAWMQYLPTYWLAAIYAWVGASSPYAHVCLYAILGITTPLLCMVLITKYLSPSFMQKMVAIDAASSGQANETLAHKKQKKGNNSNWVYQLANRLNKSKDAQAAFLLTWWQTNRSRTFKIKVLPSYAMMPMYILGMFFLKEQQPLTESIQIAIKKPSTPLLLIYMTSYVFFNAITYFIHSDAYKASWVYYAAPIQQPGKVILGGLKAIWLKYFIPFYLIVCTIVLSIWHWSALPDLVLGLLHLSIIMMVVVLMSYRALPFSKIESMQTQQKKFLRGMFALLVPFVLGMLHFAVHAFLWLKILLIILMAIAVYYLIDSILQTPWSLIKDESDL